MSLVGRFLRFLFRKCVYVLGMFTLIWILAAMTPVSWSVLRIMAEDRDPPSTSPDYIIVLGGGGIPSASGLMRCYAAAGEARVYPDARILIAMPRGTVIRRWTG